MTTKLPAQTTNFSNKNRLRYFSLRGVDQQQTPSVSLSPSNSDQVDNHTVLNALVATLVKYGSSGKIEPYIADSWHISEDGKVWQFYIRDGFSCESGEKVTAESFKAGLLSSFQRNLVKSDKTEFNLLTGWHNYISGTTQSLAGITSENRKLTFTFDKAPSGLLNFLRMPYFGYWCPSNFPGGKFRIDGLFASSGPYRLAQVLSKSKLLLQMRNDQPSFHSEAPQNIEIGYASASDLAHSDGAVIAKMVVEDNANAPQGFTAIDGPPLIFQGIVLHPNSKFFHNIHNRQVFAKRLAAFKKRNSSFGFSDGFYLTSKLDVSKSTDWPDRYTNIGSDVVKIAFQYKTINPNVQRLWQDLFASVLSDVKYELHFAPIDDSEWIKFIINNSDFSIRTAQVYPGAHPVVSVIKMMFCTHLGISFPDPSGKICKLVEKYSETNSDADNDFENAFNRTLADDGVVFPLFHAKDRWLVSKDIDLSTMPTSIIHPLFEKIRFK